jgi:hypothetical protein
MLPLLESSLASFASASSSLLILPKADAGFKLICRHWNVRAVTISQAFARVSNIFVFPS